MCLLSARCLEMPPGSLIHTGSIVRRAKVPPYPLGSGEELRVLFHLEKSLGRRPLLLLRQGIWLTSVSSLIIAQGTG